MTIYFIGPTGNDDTGDGSLGNPYASVSTVLTICSNGDTIKALTGIYIITSTTNIDKQVTVTSNSGVNTDVIFSSNCTIFNLQESNITISNVTLQTSNVSELLTIDRMSTGESIPIFFTGNSVTGCNLKYVTLGISLNGSFSILSNVFTRYSGTNIVTVMNIYSSRNTSSINDNTFVDLGPVQYVIKLTSNGTGSYLDRCNSKGGTLTITSNTVNYSDTIQSTTFFYQNYFNLYTYTPGHVDIQYNPNTKLSINMNNNNITYECTGNTIVINTKSNSDFSMFGPCNINTNTNNTTDYGLLHLGKDTSSHTLLIIDSSDLNRSIFKLYSNTLNSLRSPVFITGQTASLVIGQSDFTSNISGITSSRIMQPFNGMMIYNNHFYLFDNANSRILIFNPIPISNLPIANSVLGQIDFTTGTGSCTQSTFNRPTGSAICPANNKLYVCDTNNNRIMIYASIPTSHTNAESIMGQSDFTTNTSGIGPRSFANPRSIKFVGSKCYLIDTLNNRIIIWNDITTYNQSSTVPDFVLGQVDFTSKVILNPPTASSLNHPLIMYCDNTKIIATDSTNNRILIWNTPITMNAQSANVVVGQPDFISNTQLLSRSGTNMTIGLTSNGSMLIVSDRYNNRVLIWNTIPTSNGAPADIVIGQDDFTSNTTGLSSTRCADINALLLYQKTLYVMDSVNYRVLRFDGI